MANFMLYVKNKKSNDSGRIFHGSVLFLFSHQIYSSILSVWILFTFIGLENPKVWKLLHYTPVRK